jgi:hypothetical protein
MKGIYLTEEGKKEIESKIAELENELQLVGNLFEEVERNPYYISNKIKVYQEILSSATMISGDKLEDGLNIDTIYHPIKTII